jgi:hypothetical protein
MEHLGIAEGASPTKPDKEMARTSGNANMKQFQVDR